MLVYDLHVVKKVPLARVKQILDDVDRHTAPRPPAAPLPQVGMARQSERSLFILRSRTLGIVLDQLLGLGTKKTDVVIHLRQFEYEHQKRTRDGFSVRIDRRSQNEAEREVGKFKDTDFRGRVDESGELLLSGLPEDYITDFHYQSWLRLEVDAGSPVSRQVLYVGLPAHFDPRNVRRPENGNHRELLALLLLPAALDGKSQLIDLGNEGGKPDFSALIQNLVETIPHIWPSWHYCTLFTEDPFTPKSWSSLQPAVGFQRGFSVDASRWGRHCRVGCSNRITTRLLSRCCPEPIRGQLTQRDENATAAVALPTHAQGRCNGVLYVGSREDDPDQYPVFSENGISFLGIVADVVGETIDRQRTRRDAAKSAAGVLDRHITTWQPWSQLTRRLGGIARALIEKGELPGENDNVHMTAIRIQVPESFRRQSPDVGTWIDKHLRRIVVEFFLRQGYLPEDLHATRECRSRIRLSHSTDQDR